MATYSFIKYDVLKDLMYFKSTPTPNFKQIVKTEGISTTQDREFIEGVKSASNNLIPQEASDFIKSFLQEILILDLNNSKSINLRIEIKDDNTVGEVLIISQNLDKTITTISIPNNNWPESIESKIKPEIKFPTLGKCADCLKFSFEKDNILNFVGNIGGQWNGTWKNGQKVYQFSLPDYSNPSTYGNTVDYRIFWKPGINYTVNLYSGGTLTINNEAKWIATPFSSIGTVNELSNQTFFHVLSNASASCPHTLNPLNPNFNFVGNQGNFLLSAVPNQTTPIEAVTKCPVFTPTPGPIDWGWNCGPNGCVSAPSGSPGTYATFAQCEVSCSVDPSNIVEYICTSNGCVQVPSGSGGFATLAECEGVCNYFPIEECDCSEPLVSLLNPDFNSGSLYWSFNPPTSTPGVGFWNFTSFNANASVQNVNFNIYNTSSLSLSQENVFQLGCIYEICFKAWTSTPDLVSSISIDTGNYTSNPPIITSPLTGTPTAYNFVISNIETTDLTFYVAGNGRISINDICIKKIYCPPTPQPGECLIDGVTYCYTDIEYDCNCPDGFTSDGSGSCIGLGPSTISASAGVTLSAPSLGWPNQTILTSSFYLSPGFSILQPYSPELQSTPSLATNYIYATLPLGPNSSPSIVVHGHIRCFAGCAQPILFYNNNFQGVASTSSTNPSPFFGDPNVYNTQYTFDILKNDFWIQPELSPYNWTERWVTKLMRNMNETQVPANMWKGIGTTINTPTTKTYYIGVIGNGALKIKVNGNTLINTGLDCSITGLTSNDPLGVNTGPFSPYAVPVARQNAYSRTPSNILNYVSSYPAPIYSINPYISNFVTGSITQWYSTQTTPAPLHLWPFSSFIDLEYTETFDVNTMGTNLYIYPITLPAGCNKVNIEAFSLGHICNYSSNAFGAIIFDMTAEQLVNASSYNDLNIVWDSSQLTPYSSSLTPYYPQHTINYYLYDYTASLSNFSSINPPTSSYLPLCPSGSTAVGGNPCNGCTKSGSFNSITIPCGNCVECTHGLLYNGYVVDAGGPTYTGRGNGGIVNTNNIDNPINTWKIPENNDWYNLITYVNNSIPPSTLTPTGSYGVQVGGKLKDYTRDLIATCWEFPNVGAQTDDFSSGWNGVAGGVRNELGAFSGLKLEGYWWTANSTLPSSPLKSAAINLKHYSNEIYRYDLFKSHGCSIRLVRPTEPGEVDSNIILDAYKGNDGTLYDGIVLGNQVWLTKNLSETKYNNGSNVLVESNSNVWDDTLTTANKFSCYYNNQSINSNLPVGNVNPITGLCYEYSKLYVYRKCDGTSFLAQTEPGATLTPGEVQKANDLSCWEFFAEYTSSPDIVFTEYYTGNYFENNPTIYADCEECNALHTIYMTFQTKNC